MAALHGASRGARRAWCSLRPIGAATARWRRRREASLSLSLSLTLSLTLTRTLALPLTLIVGKSLFFAAPNSAQRRERLTLHRSDDGGRSWPRSLLLHAGPSAYSSLTLLPGGCLGVLFERGERRASFFAEQIAFLRLPLAASAGVSVSPVGTLEEPNATSRWRSRGALEARPPSRQAPSGDPAIL